MTGRPDSVLATEHLMLLVQSQPDFAIFLLDPSGVVQTWNRGAERLKGYAADEIIGRHFSSFYTPEDLERDHPSEVLARARTLGRHEEEGWRVRKDGTRFWADIVITALHDEDGTHVGFGKVTRDLTSRRLAEEQLRVNASELARANADLDQFRLLVASVRDYAIFVLDPRGHIATWNAGAERIKGYSASEAIGRHFELFYTDEARAIDHPAHELEVASREGRFEEEGWRVRKDGTRFWASVVITAMRDERGVLVGYAKVTRDLTERRRAEEELRARAEQLREANRRLEQSEGRARADAGTQRRRTAAIELVGRAIVGRQDLSEIVQTATDAATDLVGAQFGVFLDNVTSAEQHTLSAISGEGRFSMPRDAEVLAPTFAGAAIVRSDDVTADPRFDGSDLRVGLVDGDVPVRSYLAVPVVTGDNEIAGGLFFGHAETGVFDDADEEAAVSIAASAGVAIANARALEEARHEAEARAVALEQRDRVAQVLQQSLLPPELPAIAGLELAAEYHAGTELVGGDFYDVFALGERRWGIVVGDVCGSGPEAAAQTALSRHSARTSAMFDSEPPAVLLAVNEVLRRSEAERFTTATFVRLSARDDGAFDLDLSAGGHPPAILVPPAGPAREVEAAGSLLGVLDRVEHEHVHFVLEPGATLVLYTDGLVEARQGADLFGAGRLAELVTKLRDAPPAEIARSAVEAAVAHAGRPVTDDIAVVVVRVPAR